MNGETTAGNEPPPFPCAPTPLLIPGPVGVLELLPACPATPVTGAVTAVICHPHPLHGGSMHNKVVHTLARAFGELGARSVRFNFRGVGQSTGEFADAVGEMDDLLAVVQWVQRHRPDDELWLAGFSFGAYVALKASARVSVRQLVLVAPPVNLYDFNALARPACPMLVIQGGADEVVPAQDVVRWVEGVTPPVQLAYFDDVSHFFHLRLNDLRAGVTQYLRPNGSHEPG